MFWVEDKVSEVGELVFPGHVPSDTEHLEFVRALVERVNTLEDVLLKHVQILRKVLLLCFLLFARRSAWLFLGNRTPVRPSNIAHAVRNQLNLNLLVRLFLRLLVLILFERLLI